MVEMLNCMVRGLGIVRQILLVRDLTEGMGMCVA
jgi:hypothetical protein